MFVRNAINWFEIPTTDMQRAKNFYETIFGFELVDANMPGFEMLMFPTDDMGGVGGAIINGAEFNSPSATGTMVYINGNPDLSAILDRVEGAGGTVVMPKTEIDAQIGFMAVFIDTEGNRIGLHSSPAAA